jgi:hypothetical protein
VPDEIELTTEDPEILTETETTESPAKNGFQVKAFLPFMLINIAHSKAMFIHASDFFTF